MSPKWIIALASGLIVLAAPGCASTMNGAQSEKAAPASLFPSGWVGEGGVTLNFQADGAVSGSTGCNRYVGQAQLRGDRIDFAPLAVTRMACTPGLMAQESRFLAALGAAERAAIAADGRLELYGPGAAEPSRFSPQPATR
ncbi:MAG: META domain-containing protein [Alphaproteobacteria bacterium]|nr:META domain-containing protein [Alphaproteobacteria bacterium]